MKNFYLRFCIILCAHILGINVAYSQVSFNYDSITICQGDSYDLLNYQTNEMIVPVGWEIVGWKNISNTTVTPMVSPTVYTVQYREIANPAVILTHDLTITLRPKPTVSIAPSGSQVICVGQPIHIDKLSATDYDNLYWQYVQKGVKYYTNAIDTVAAQGNIDNKMTYKLIATNNNCAVVAQAQMEYSVLKDDKYPIYRFHIPSNNARESTPAYYCGTGKIEDYVKPIDIVVPSTPTGDMSFDPYSSSYTSLPPNSDYLHINPNWAQKSENDIVKLTRYEVRWATQDQYTAGGEISGGISYTNNYTLEVDLYFKACGTTKTYTYNGTLYLYPSCPSAWTPYLIYHCSEINGQGQFGINNAAGTTVSNLVYENLTLPGKYISQGTGGYLYTTFDNSTPLQMTYRITFDYTDDKGNKQFLTLEKTINTCYIKKQISYATATYDYGFKPWLAYNGGYYAPYDAEANNNEAKMKGDTIETTVCLGSPAYLSIASNVPGKQNVLWRNSERPVLRTQYNESFYGYDYDLTPEGYKMEIDSLPCYIFKVNPTKTTTYTGTLEGLEFAFKVNVVNNHIAAIDTAICRGQSIDLKTLERIDNISGTVAWNVSNTLVTPAVDTKYTVYGIARDKCANQADYTITDNVSIHVDEQLWNTTVSEVGSCAGDRVNLNEFLNTNARSFKWYNANGELLPDGIIKIAGDTYYTVEMSNGCGTKTQNIQVKETPACYDYEFAKRDTLSTAICATDGLNGGYPIGFSRFTVSPLSNDGSLCETPMVNILTQTTMAGTKAVYSSGKIYYDTSYKNIIDYSGQRDSVQYEVCCEFKKDTAWAYFEIRDEQVLSLSELKINAQGSEITLTTNGMSPSKRDAISIGLISADGTTFYETLNLTDTAVYTFKYSPSFPDGKYYYFAYNRASMCIIEDSIELRNGQIVHNGACISDTTHIDTTIIQGQSYTFGTKTYTTAAQDTLRLKNVLGCDSLIILNLTVLKGCANGTLLFKEDFGGNETTDDVIKATGIPQVSGYTYIGPGQTAISNQTYFIRKTAYPNGDWHKVDDHTYFEDYTRGYFLQVDASNTAGTFYSKTITDVCPDTKLYFSAWALNSMVLWRQSSLHAYSPNISYVIRDAKTNALLLKYDTGDIPNDSTWYPAEYSQQGWYNTRQLSAHWMQYGTPFTVPSGVDSIVFSLENNATHFLGADFALDDIEIRLCVPSIRIQGDTVCQTQPVSLDADFVNDGSFVEPLAYKWQQNVSGNLSDEASWKDVSTNKIYDIAATSVSNQGYYRLLIANQNNIDKQACRAVSNTVFLKVNTPAVTSIKDTICANSTYSFNNKSLSVSGLYADTLSSSSGCDSIVNLDLKVNAIEKYAYTDSICLGSTYIFKAKTLTQAGTYVDTLQSSQGCDSIVTFTLKLRPTKHTQLQQTICQGSVYSFGGKSLSEAGIYTDSLFAASACDSIVTLTLNIKQKPDVVLRKEICPDETYLFEGAKLSATGMYTKNYNNPNTCDSTITLYLTVLQADTTYLAERITEGETYFFNGMSLTKPGRYIAYYSNAHHCDSVILLDLILNSAENKVRIPQLFTPNNDGDNDYFVIEHLEEYPKNYLLIFNRWGNKVYEGKPYMNSWDGRNYFGSKMGGDLLPVGTYFYILDLGDGSAVEKGFIYLNR